jgi:hypothetical protein
MTVIWRHQKYIQPAKYDLRAANSLNQPLKIRVLTHLGNSSKDLC